MCTLGLCYSLDVLVLVDNTYLGVEREVVELHALQERARHSAPLADVRLTLGVKPRHVPEHTRTTANCAVTSRVHTIFDYTSGFRIEPK